MAIPLIRKSGSLFRRSRCIDAQIHQATHIEQHALFNAHKPKKHVLASGAPRNNARTLHVHVRFREVFSCAAVRAVCLSSRNINLEYVAQFTRSCIAVKVVAM
jgi:hypothetical protein